jgi:hypothetical protein
MRAHGVILCSLALHATGLGFELVAAGAERDEAAAPSSSQPSTQPATQPSSQPATQAAQELWPPGLLMECLGFCGARTCLDQAGIRLWGFVEPGFTGDLTNGDDPIFGRTFDARRPNNLRLNQLRITADRLYDSNRPFDLGFRVDGLFGGDAFVTHTPGLFFHAGEGTGDAWADIVQMYVQGWFSTGTDSGLESTLGKMLCPMTAETVDATGNALYSHSYLFNFATPDTYTGVREKYIFNKQFSAYAGVVEGWNLFQDNNHAPSYIAGATLTSAEQVGGQARDQLAFNAHTGPEQPGNTRNFRTLLDAVGTHRWSSKLSSTLEGDWGTEEDVPGIGRADWYGVVHYLTYVCSERVSTTWRTEWFADDSGQFIGEPGNYYENTLGLSLTPWPGHAVLKNLTARPEIRWDSSDQAVFGGEHNQLTVAIDVIFRF